MLQQNEKKDKNIAYSVGMIYMPAIPDMLDILDMRDIPEKGKILLKELVLNGRHTRLVQHEKKYNEMEFLPCKLKDPNKTLPTITLQTTKNKKKPCLYKKTGSVCCVCDETLGDDAVRLHKTRRQQHSMCNECALGYLKPIFEKAQNNVRKNIRHNIGMFKCPGTYHSSGKNRCCLVIDLKEIDIPDEDMKMSQFRINYIMSNDLAYMCPNIKCGNIIDVDKYYTKSKLICIMCNTQWCRRCNTNPYHENKSCLEYELENSSSENGKFILEMKQKGLLKFCPQCKSPTMKHNGCNKMVCIECVATWCWLCSMHGVDYDHYKNGKCDNKLWEGVDEDGNDLMI